MTDLLQNFVYCQLTSDVDGSTTTFPVDNLSRLPSNLYLSGNDFWMTVESTYAADAFEIVKVTTKSADSGAGNLTVVRGQESTTAAAHAASTYVKATLTAGIVQRIIDSVQAVKFYTEWSDWSSGTGYSGGSLVTRNGGLYITANATSGDPLVPSDYQASGFYLIQNDNTGIGQGYLSGQTKAAQGFKVSADQVSYGFIFESLVNPPDGTVVCGIATDLGGGTPTYLTSVTVNVSGVTNQEFNAIWPEPVTLAADTQYYFTVIGDSGIVDSWLYQDVAHLGMDTSGVGAKTDATYTMYYDASFASSVTNARFWVFNLGAPINDWQVVVPSSFPQTGTSLPAASADYRGKVFVVTGSGVADRAYMCLAASDGTTFTWVPLLVGIVLTELAGGASGLAALVGALSVMGGVSPPTYVQSAHGSCIYFTTQTVTWPSTPTPGDLLIAMNTQLLALAIPDQTHWTHTYTFTHTDAGTASKLYTRTADGTSNDNFFLDNTSANGGNAVVMYEFANAAYDSATGVDNHTDPTNGTLATPGITAAPGDVVLSFVDSVTGGNVYVSMDGALSNIQEALGNGQEGAAGGWEAIAASGVSTPRTGVWQNSTGIDVMAVSVRLIGAALVLPTVTSGTLIGRYAADSFIADSDGASLASWPDLSGNGYNLTPNTSQPTYVASGIGGKGSVHFDGVADAMVDTGFPSVGQPFTVFAVAKLDSTNTDYANITTNITGATAPFFITPAQQLAEYAGVTGTSTSAFDVTQAHVLECVFNNTSSKVAIDGTTNATSPGTDSMNGGLVVGAGSTLAGSFLKGQIAEVLIYSGALDSGDLSAVRGYLGVKYGITVS